MSGEYNKTIFSNNLKMLIDKKGIKATDVAKAMGVSRTTVSSWTNAIKIPRMNMVQALSEYFMCSTADLLEDPSNRTIEEKLQHLLSQLSEEQKKTLLALIEQMLPSK